MLHLGRPPPMASPPPPVPRPAELPSAPPAPPPVPPLRPSEMLRRSSRIQGLPAGSGLANLAHTGAPDLDYHVHGQDVWAMSAQLSADVGEVPRTFEEAVASPQAAEWRKAMDEEMDSLSAHRTWNSSPWNLNRRASPCSKRHFPDWD
ncbi:MAG: hypothetical protein B7Z72_13550 [Gemmatimonadetes bacterium 21-71-4]|nr:MAG: hypothetical protein B7Z72_13550 [Gemmatimonadetes bacterium 21-71-4]